MANRETPIPSAAVPPWAMAAPPWIETHPVGQPFDFTKAMTALIDDVCLRVAEFSHIRSKQLLIGYVASRNNRRAGLLARVTPLRFAGGQMVKQARGRSYQVQQFTVDGNAILYIMAFCLPRFLNQSFDEKFTTIFHELFHISPSFDGDLRRHHGRCAFHTNSKSAFDAEMSKMARAYLAKGADPRLHNFLRLDAAQLKSRHGMVVGQRAPRAKIIPITP